RFGPTDEIGVFEMTGLGLSEVTNPSALFLSQRDLGTPGTAVFAGMEGTRPLLVEIQALVAPTTLGTPRRAVVGWDTARLSMVLAVLEAHCGARPGPGQRNGRGRCAHRRRRLLAIDAGGEHRSRGRKPAAWGRAESKLDAEPRSVMPPSRFSWLSPRLILHFQCKINAAQIQVQA